jgi:hypothetical protein
LWDTPPPPTPPRRFAEGGEKADDLGMPRIEAE